MLEYNGIKLKPIVKIGVLIDKNLPKTIFAAKSVATINNFLIFFIIKTPFSTTKKEFNLS